MARADADQATLEEIGREASRLERDVAALEFRRMFSNPLDPNNCFADIQAGSGGTEAQDWAAMLERMYIKYCDKKGFAVEVRSEEHTSELQSLAYLVCRLLLEKKKKKMYRL